MLACSQSVSSFLFPTKTFQPLFQPFAFLDKDGDCLGTDALPLLKGNPQLSSIPAEDVPLCTPVVGLASPADSWGAALANKCRGPDQGCQTTEAVRVSARSSLNLMCSYQGQKTCQARALPKIRWGFPCKNPYWTMERGPGGAQGSEMGQREPRYSLDQTVMCPTVTQEFVKMPVLIQQGWGRAQGSAFLAGSC